MKTTILGSIQLSREGNLIDAEVLIQSGYWIIRYQDALGHSQQLSWIEDDVKQLTGTQSFVVMDNAYPSFTSAHPTLTQRTKPKPAFIRWFKKRNETALIGSVAVCIVFGVLALWKIVPLIANGLAMRIPIEKEKKLGTEMKKAFLADFSVDSTLTALVNEYADSLSIPSLYDLELHVVASDQINAFALPGGTIVLYSAILKKMNRHEALAALIGHEATHIEQRHSLKSLSRSMAWTTICSMILGGSDALSGMLVKNVNNLTALKYSRSLEEEADARSIQILNDKNIDVHGMIDLMNALQQTDTTGHAIEFLQTHPLTEKRLAHAVTAANTQPAPIKHADLEKIWLKIADKKKTH